MCKITSCHGMLFKGHLVQASAMTTRAPRIHRCCQSLLFAGCAWLCLCFWQWLCYNYICCCLTWHYTTKLLPKHSSAHLTYYFLLTFSILYLLFNTFYHLDAESILIFQCIFSPILLLSSILLSNMNLYSFHHHHPSFILISGHILIHTAPPLVPLQPLAFSIVHIRALIGCFCCCLLLGHLRRPGKGRQPPHSLWCHHHAPPRLSINPHLWLCVSETRFNRER